MMDRLKKSTIPSIVPPLLVLDGMNPDSRLAGSGDNIYLGRSYQLLRFEIAHDDTTSTITPIRYFVSHARSIEAIEIELHGRVADAVGPLSTLLNICAVRTDNLTVREYTDVSRHRKLRHSPWTQEGGPFRFVYRRPEAEVAADDEASKPSSSKASDPFEYPRIGNLLSGSFYSLGKVREGSVNCPPISSWVIESQTPRYVVALPPQPHILQLKSFELDANELFAASMYPWVHHVLNTAHLTRLSISVKLTAIHWEYILPTLTLHQLEHLAFLDIPLRFPHLLSFLRRHLSLQIFEISNEVEHNPVGEISFPKHYLHDLEFLPSLERLIATPEYIIPFSAHAQPEFLPRLKIFDLRGCFYEPNSGPFPGAWGKREDRHKLFRPIFEHLRRLSEENSTGSQTGTPRKKEHVPERKLHIKLYTMSLTALVEAFILPDEDDSPGKVGPMTNVYTVTLVYANGWIPPSLAMHLVRHWAPHQEKLSKAFERAKELFTVHTGGTADDDSLNTSIQAPKDVWLLNLFLCHAFPRLERIISEYRGCKHEVEVDRSLFD
ncbi:hypothetical protein CPB83DRAFT_272164 [Crepidotus variabilis]|uniref:Uncharacterized protein n=1 Tax=Crepidotus variabilis TaxID=179855 RepID=A0A9P6EGM8_9AGAR|nr:hypothetical protein CPB83DRAFT_272164 [Crepidotus variabilis]